MQWDFFFFFQGKTESDTRQILIHIRIRVSMTTHKFYPRSKSELLLLGRNKKKERNNRKTKSYYLLLANISHQRILNQAPFFQPINCDP